ncbi:hypothetical protein [Methylobacterium sp. Leaf85]|uniref:hypothetical protein n=1 Tax=Methylobacterium sp. Leaf85 TaxID=1736241 RepID=UPI0012E81BAE|nr:hypothetical protein [Methylobacterium sp. Leaf85]
MQIEVTAEELRYIIRCGAALAQLLPNTSLPTYCGFDRDQIVEFSARMRNDLEKEGLDM